MFVYFKIIKDVLSLQMNEMIVFVIICDLCFVNLRFCDLVLPVASSIGD